MKALAKKHFEQTLRRLTAAIIMCVCVVCQMRFLLYAKLVGAYNILLTFKKHQNLASRKLNDGIGNDKPISYWHHELG